MAAEADAWAGENDACSGSVHPIPAPVPSSHNSYAGMKKGGLSHSDSLSIVSTSEGLCLSTMN